MHISDETSMDAYQEIERLGATPLWLNEGNMFPPEPKSRALPFVWRYSELRNYLLYFAQTLSLHVAERRALMLTNPGIEGQMRTVNTLSAGLQILLPGENAQAHRHSTSAFRFIIEGSGGYTTLNGERVHMHPRDLLLTPGWYWHDHGHEGKEPMIWLDGLDYPLVKMLEAGFFEDNERAQKTTHHPDDLSTRQFIHGRLNPLWLQPQQQNPIGNYPWSETEKAFAAIADDAEGSVTDGILLEYTDPRTGGPVMPTIGCRILRLRPHFHGRAHRHTSSTIYHVVRGQGTTIVDGIQLEWGEHDIFAVPGWAVHEHINSAGKDAVLFAYTDEPAMRALGLYRETECVK